MTMNAQQMSAVFDAKKYGLTKTNASGIDHDKGIVQGPDGSYYEIDGFQHGQEDDIDQDKGKVFGTSLQADAKAAGFDPSNFNTAGDVQNAINALGSAPAAKKADEPYTQSETLSKAKAGVAAYEDTILPNAGDYITGKKKDMQGDYLNSYKLNLAKEMKPRNSDGTPRESKIQEEKDKVEGAA